jgi:beta-xylosidase
MYFSATSAEDEGKHCIGVATSDSPTGPFQPTSDDPWVCDLDAGGNIDPAQFTDTDLTKWVVYKVDGNSIGSDSTAIMLQQVEEDGYTKVGDAIEILNRDDNDGPLVEAPSLAEFDGIYYLTFSSNMYNTDLYDTSWATADSVTGPYTKITAPDAPLLVTGDRGLTAPGGADMIPNGLANYIVWHANCDSGRCMYVSTFTTQDGIITVNAMVE